MAILNKIEIEKHKAKLQIIILKEIITELYYCNRSFLHVALPVTTSLNRKCYL